MTILEAIVIMLTFIVVGVVDTIIYQCRVEKEYKKEHKDEETH